MNLSKEMTDVNFASDFGMNVPAKFLLWFANLAAAAEKLEERDDWLSCLEWAGVDNWQGYDFAFEIQKEHFPERYEE